MKEIGALVRGENLLPGPAAVVDQGDEVEQLRRRTELKRELAGVRARPEVAK